MCFSYQSLFLVDWIKQDYFRPYWYHKTDNIKEHGILQGQKSLAPKPLAHIQIFINIIKQNGLVVSKSKINLFQTRIRFLGHNIYQGTIIPMERSIEFANKFPDQIKDKVYKFAVSIDLLVDEMIFVWGWHSHHG